MKKNYSIPSFCFSLFFVSLLYLFFTPYWMTNDDVGMSMIAHGYGSVAIKSPNLLFSNVIWGYIVQNIPEINGILGYATGTVLALFFTTWAFTYALLKAKINCFLIFFILLILLMRPIIFPQFTVNAGLLAVASFFFLLFYLNEKNKIFLILSSILFFLGWSIRSHEAYFVLLVSLPLFPWGKIHIIMKDKFFQYVVLVLVFSLSVASYVNYKAYQAPEWKNFNEFNTVRVKYTDYGITTQLRKKPDVLTKYGYSINDIILISGWFFVDPKLNNIENLKAVSDEVKIADRNYMDYSIKGFYTITQVNLFIGFLVCLICLIMRPSIKLSISWILFIVVLIAFGILGRPYVTRIYVPILSLLTLFPLIACPETEKGSQKIVIYSIICAFIALSTIETAYKSLIYDEKNKNFRKELVDLPDYIVAWEFSYERAYPVFYQVNDLNFKFYSLSSFTLAPWSISYQEEKNGRGFHKLLSSKQGLPLMTNQRGYVALGTYCKERLKGKFVKLRKQLYGQKIITWVQCK